MHQVQKILDGIYWIGGNDFFSRCFENHIPLPQGITYNSYFIDDEKTAVVDTVDTVIADLFMGNVEYLLRGRPLDYIIINHMEPDHSSFLLDLAEKYPGAKICGSAAALRMFEQFFHQPMKDRYIVTNEKMSISLGRRTLRFFLAPMVHWPEVTFTYDETDQVLFSADAFGTFGTLQSGIFADDTDYPAVYGAEARRYYTCIVSKYGPQVQAAMKKVAAVPVKILAPLHGPVFRTEEDLQYIWKAMERWARWEPSVRGVLICHASIYGNTAKAAQMLAWDLRQKGVRQIEVIDLCKTDVSFAMAGVMAYSHIVFASPTYNMGLFPRMRTFLDALGAHLVHDRFVSFIGNSSWAPNVSNKLMMEKTASWKNTEVLGLPVQILSSVGEKEEEALDTLAGVIAAHVNG